MTDVSTTKAVVIFRVKWRASGRQMMIFILLVLALTGQFCRVLSFEVMYESFVRSR